MVMCKYFLEGRCYFGDSCRNEHSYDSSRRPAPNYYAAQRQPSQQTRNMTEVKQIVVEEIKALEAGHQWPFSCFSPLKDDHMIPGMDDISPEELRQEAYQAQNQNNFEGYKMRVAILKQDYQNKRNQLINMDANLFREIFIEKSSNAGSSFSQAGSNQATNVFGTASTSNTSFQSASVFGNQPPTSAASPFSFSNLSNNAQQSQSVFGGNVFSQPTSTYGQPSTFSNTAPVSNVFGQTATTSVFGQSTPAPPPSYSQTFGQIQPVASSNIFGQPQPITSSASVFGQVATTSTNIFGQVQPVASSTNVFGQSQPVTSTTNVFSQAQPITNVFGQTQASVDNVFGQAQPSLFGQVQAPTQTTNTFGQVQPTANVFGQPQPVVSSANPNLFGQSQSAFTTNTNMFSTQSFGSQPAFGQNQFSGQQTFGDQTPQKSIFSLQSTPTTPPTNIFNQTTSENAFSTPTTNAFTQNVFTSVANTPTQSVFAGPQTSQPQNVFNQPNSNPIAQTPFPQQQNENVNPFTQAAVASTAAHNHYSKMEELSVEYIAYFQADEFVLGKIPTKPPPLEIA